MTKYILRHCRHILVAMAACIAIFRFHTLHEPPETDLTVYSVIGRELLKGRKLYSDLWDIKPPAIYWTYALAATLTPNGAWMRYWLWVSATLATLVGVYRCTRELTRLRIASLWAAATWTILSPQLNLQANQPNTEVFLNAAVVWATALLLRTHSTSITCTRDAFGSGLLLGLASLYKPVILPWTCGFAVVHIFATRRSPRASATRPPCILYRLQSAFAFLVGAGTLPLLALSILSLQGNLSDFLDTMFRWNRWYARSPILNAVAGYTPTQLLPPEMRVLVPALVLSLLGLAGLLLAPLRSQSWYLITAVALLPAVIGLPGRGYPHYYQLWLPWLAILLPVAPLVWRRHLRDGYRRALLGTALACTFWYVFSLAQDLRLSAVEWSIAKYGPCFVNEEKLGQYLGKVLAPNETFFVWGNTPTLYEAALRPPPTGVFFVIPLLYGPTTDTLSRRTLRQLQLTMPEAIVINVADNPLPASHPIVQWYSQNYKAHSALVSPDAKFRLYCRKNGTLIRRLESGTTSPMIKTRGEMLIE